jgi:hypothetical protein
MSPDTAVITVGASVLGAAGELVADESLHARCGGSILIVDFHRHGNSARYRKSGWSGQEEGHVWSLSGESVLQLPPRQEDGAFTVEVDFSIGVSRFGLRTAVMRIFANGHCLGRVRARGWTRVRCNVPAGLIAPDEPLTLRFEHPCYIRLDYLDPGAENRPDRKSVV